MDMRIMNMRKMNMRIGLVVVAAILMAANVRAAEAYVVVSGGAVDGCKAYTDRDYVYQSIPAALQGADYVQMLIEDRFVAGPSTPFLELTLSKPSTVTVGVDSRAKEPLSWLASWNKIGKQALAAKHLKMELYSKAFPAGKVVLNGAKVNGAQVMYVVFASEGSLAGIKRIAAHGGSSGYDRAADQHNFTVFMKDGGWCWYQDPRVIVNDGKLIIGGVQGNGTGPAQVGIYDLDAGKALGTVLMQDNFDRDDHNSPVFYTRPDNRILSVYAKHHKEPKFYTRISESGNPLKWSDERSYDTKDHATYANLYELKQENKLYNFFRGIQFNPTFVTSTDGGKTWGDETHFIKSEVKGGARPYCRYASNGKDTVFVSFTDGHPRKVGNSIYYAEFRNGSFWRADGTLIKNLATDGPLRPSEAELVFKGSGEMGTRARLSVPDSAWTSSMAIDKNGHPHMAYTLYKSNEDHRYRIATWDGTQWHDREVAYGGNCLYDGESSYTGLIALDPRDPEYAVISTDVNPQRGSGNGTHEIYRARVGLKDSINQIRWEAITRRSPVRNIRPMIVYNGEDRVVLWNRGAFSSFTNYQLDTVGFVENNAKADQAVDPSNQAAILELMKRAKDFQERGGRLGFNWIDGTFYSGVFACYEATGETEFLKAARDWCASGNYHIGGGHLQNGDAICTAQTFLDVYSVDKDPNQIESINSVFEKYYFIADKKADRKLLGYAPWMGPNDSSTANATGPFDGRHVFWWADSLYMTPPLMARLGAVTGNPAYYELLHELFWGAVDHLYDPDEQLFFRDMRFFKRKTPKGQPVFWARGQGWVIGGLVRTIDFIPESDPMRGKYIKLFQEMMERIVSLQGEDGLWRSSVNEPEWFPMKETSGSSFFTFGLAAGINRGWLDREKYTPFADKAWKGLSACVSGEGKVQWSQPVADQPFVTRKENTRSYTQGAFLLAAAEIYKLNALPKVIPKKEATKTFCRLVPERAGDFAWENDLVAFRAYGPKLRKGGENSGIDCWLKRVETPIIDKWYGQMKTKSYHTDWGEGHDPYHVGSSAGCGGTGIWLNGKREPLETYTKQEVIECTTERTQFKLTYEREIDGDVYGEEKTITIELGKRLFDVHSVFTKNGKVASNLPICIGLTTHDGKAETFSNEKQGWIACWEKIAGSEVGTAAMVDPKRIVAIQEVQSDTKDESHHFILMKTDRNGAIDYQAGYGWKKAGEIKTSDDWNNYLNEN
jgi:rhamnogalacturonyl hydrolase YesR